MFCSIKPRNHQTRRGNKIKLIFTRLRTRKNDKNNSITTNNINKHRALNNLVKYLKHIENDKKLMGNANNRNYLSQDKIHISELQEKLRNVNKTLNNANRKALVIGETIQNNVKQLSDTQKEIKISLDQKI